MAKHDENLDVRSISRIGRVNPYDKTISINKATLIGNKRWGRIDYLVNHCGYTLLYNNELVLAKSVDDNEVGKTSKRKVKEVTKKKANTKMYK